MEERDILPFLIAAIAILLLAFFFPKHCGSWATTVPNTGTTYPDCNCLGFKINEHPGRIGGDSTNCWGIVTSKTCYENNWTKELGYFRYYKPCD